MNLIIVESPTKARTFLKFLNKNKYTIFATAGHIRDLPKNKLAIDYQNQFKPEYQIISNKKNIINKLKELAKNYQKIIIATDPDREGESIGYHIAYLLGYVKENWPEIKINDSNNLKRIVFHEITKKAIEEALNNWEKIRVSLVKAQQARRILDRVVGYELSPVLWKKTGKNWLSAGRVQTVALKLIVEREKEIKNFAVEEFYDIYGEFVKNKEKISAKLIAKDDIKYEIKTSLNLFAGDYQYRKTTINDSNLSQIKIDLNNDSFFINKIKETVEKRNPPPPYTTSLLQQDAFYKLGFSSKLTMSLAQQLYEKGLITYHRTDSFNLSTNFVFKVREYIKKTYGENYLSITPRSYKTKSKTAQEAHEAIRPTNLKSINKDSQLNSNQKKLYQLIFNRAVATQMKEADIKVIQIDILSKKNYLFSAENRLVIFDGFLRLYQKKIDKKYNFSEIFKANDKVNLALLTEKKDQTKPPSRYNEASLIKIMEEKGIGRPSTYATIINLIQTKNYVEKENRHFLPTNLGVFISDYLSQSFSDIFNLDFTALMEDSLDKIANTEIDFLEVLTNFYQSFKKDLEKTSLDNKKVIIEEKSLGKCPLDNGDLIIKYSRFGKFIACSNYPNCKYKKNFLNTVKNKKCPKCGGEIVIKYSKNKKRFYGCSNYPNCDFNSWKISGIKS